MEKPQKNESFLSSHPNFSLDGYYFNGYTKGSNEIELRTRLPFEMCQQKKLLLSHVDVQFDLLKHYAEFYLRHPLNSLRFKFVMTNCKVLMPFITLPPDLEIAQAEI